MTHRAAFLCCLALAACSRSDQPPAIPETPSLTQCGVASYYHSSLAGNLTANGETYDPAQMTAAHKSLSFGATVRVIRMDAPRRVIVRVNDRGPFVRGRIIDLSRAAAKKIGIVGDDGIAEVCLVVTP